MTNEEKMRMEQFGFDMASPINAYRCYTGGGSSPLGMLVVIPVTEDSTILLVYEANDGDQWDSDSLLEFTTLTEAIDWIVSNHGI